MEATERSWPEVSQTTAARIRETDWAATGLGLPESWAPEFCAALEVTLGLHFAAFLWWGPLRLQIRNDAASDLVPREAALGRPGGALWDLLGEAVEVTARTGASRLALVPAPAGAGGETVALAVSLSAPWPGQGVLGVAVPVAGGGDASRFPAKTEPPGVTLPAPEISEARAEIRILRRMIAELQHASRNTISIIRSIARRTVAASESVSDYADHLDGRIAALARVQAALTRNPGVGVNLALLAADTLVAAGARETREFTLNGPEVFLRGKQAETLGLALHELTTNAVKFGALSRRTGRIAVVWQLEQVASAGSVLKLDWTERGVPTAQIAFTGRSGFGVEFFDHTMPYEIDAEVTRRFGPGGLSCRITLPLPQQGLEAVRT